MDEASGPAVEIWPDNLAAVNVFIALSTQWRVGMAGPIGLDYNVLYRKLDRMNLTPDEYDQMEEDVRTMEDVGLEMMRKRK